jgi:hypothetical protein
MSPSFNKCTALLVGSLGFLVQAGGLFWLMSFYGITAFSWFCIHVSFLLSNVLGHHIGHSCKTNLRSYRYFLLCSTLLIVCGLLPSTLTFLQHFPYLIPSLSCVLGVVCYLPLTHIWHGRPVGHIMIWLTLGELLGLWLLWGIYIISGLTGVTLTLASGFALLSYLSFTAPRASAVKCHVKA